MIVFSNRHKEALETDKLTVKIPRKIRQKIIYCMKKFNYWYGFNNQESIFYDDLKQELLENYGETSLKAYVEDYFQDVDDIEQFIIGTKPEYVLDAIELYGNILIKNKYRQDYFKKVNEIFKTENSSFRILDGTMIKLNSDFLESEIVNKAFELLKNNQFEKACRDFLSARRNYTSGDYPGTITESNNALESTIKKIVNAKEEKQKKLKEKLMKSGIIPDYFQGFCEHFENLLQSSFIIANKSSRHGKKEVPSKRNEVDKAVASFLLNLVGSLIVFIMERYEEQLVDEDIPF